MQISINTPRTRNKIKRSLGKNNCIRIVVKCPTRKEADRLWWASPRRARLWIDGYGTTVTLQSEGNKESTIQTIRQVETSICEHDSELIEFDVYYIRHYR